MLTLILGFYNNNFKRPKVTLEIIKTEQKQNQRIKKLKRGNQLIM